MNKPNGKRIAVFFTHGVSLELWDKRGIFSREVEFFRRLAEQAGEVWFFTYGKDDKRYAEKLGAHIRLFEKRTRAPNLVYAFILPFVYWRQLRQADVLRTHQMAGAIPALIAHWLLRKPLIVRCGYQWSDLLSRESASVIKRWVVFLIECVAYHRASAIVVTASSHAEYIVRRYRVSKNKIRIIPNYVDTELFRPMEVAKESGRVCFVGRLSKEKNLLNLIAAMEGLSAHLLFVGNGPDKEILYSLARTKGVRLAHHERIPNDELPRLLNTCEIFVLPSFHEGNPKVLLEAMSCAIPALGTNVPGIKDIIRHRQNGYLTEIDADSLKAGLSVLLKDIELRRDLGREARKYIEQNFTLGRVMEQEISILRVL